MSLLLLSAWWAPFASADEIEASPGIGIGSGPVVAATPDANDVPTLVLEAAVRWGIDPRYWLGVAWCESRHGLDPNAYQPASAHIGVFQFARDTWSWASRAAGLGEASPYDDRANIEVASWLLVNQGWGHWPVCGRRLY